jgi:hypothetical protein
MKITRSSLSLPLSILLLIVLPIASSHSAEAGLEGPRQELTLTPHQLDWIGKQIFQNECAGKRACLVHWNQGEAFPSLGIGHFIWYPKGVEGRFVESFPNLIRFMERRSVTLPEWLASLKPFDAPWPDRAAFMVQHNNDRIQSLRRFLGKTQAVQAEFIVTRAQTALGRIIKGAPAGQREAIRQRISALSSTPGGTYALIDYVNFKGEGLQASESYQGQGWGLLQVLQQMSQGDGITALERFREAAATVLTRRAENAPKPIERERWLAGWLVRLKTYQEAP